MNWLSAAAGAITVIVVLVALGYLAEWWLQSQLRP